MSTTPSFNLKLDRAREHLQTFKVKARSWVEGKPYSVVDERDPEPPLDTLSFAGLQRRRFRLARIDPVPDPLSLILGDSVHNLRASLDHLAMALAKAVTPAMTEKQIRGSEFPISDENPIATDLMDKKIGCVAPAARIIIEALQPHHRGNKYRDDPLWQIHELDRIDKHRSLAVCAARSLVQEIPMIGITGINRPGYNIAQMVGTAIVTEGPGALKCDDVLMRYSVIPINPEREAESQPVLSPEITFAEGGPAPLQSVIPTLDALCNYVRDRVIAPLAKFL
jgi:hypothetical protein